MAKKRKTNIELVKDFIEVSRGGVLSQMFVIEALCRYADELDSLSDEDCEEMSKKSFINMTAFRDVAREWKEKLEENKD